MTSWQRVTLSIDKEVLRKTDRICKQLGAGRSELVTSLFRKINKKFDNIEKEIESDVVLKSLEHFDGKSNPR